uniref:GmrSD restriction endonucleases C-terminal domain-containing protein n=1 Tax=Pseudoalteromonas rubra TaxID=43658 RepID=A0A0F4QP00_9GAMM|nr:hypothetical protein TW77_11430 [Pseudoalteromonas rubra]
MALLSRNKNSAASNYDFDKKKSEYFNPISGRTTFVLTNQVLSQDEWTPEVFKQRQTLLVDKLTNTWQLYD